MPDVAGGGHMGVALESTHGTYIAPAKFVAFESESLTEQRNDPWRQPILGRAVTSGKVKGREWAAGDIKMEALPEVMAYFEIASRWTLAKTGAGPYVYTMTDAAAAHIKANYKSLSVVIDRAGIGFAYTGVQVVSRSYFFEDGVPKVTYGVIGEKQTEDYTPGAVTDPSETPFGADEVSMTVAGASRTDIDSLEIGFDDSGEAVVDKHSGQEAADYIRFGEFVGEAGFEVDFESKADYNIWVARTVQELVLTCSKSANQIFTVEIHGGLYDTFEVAGLADLGSQVKASANLRAAYAAGDTAAAEIVVTTDEDITIS